MAILFLKYSLKNVIDPTSHLQSFYFMTFILYDYKTC